MASPAVVIVLVGLGLAALFCYLYTAEEPQRQHENTVPQQNRGRRSMSTDYRNSDECSICLQEFTERNRRRMLHCRHSFHDACIETWKIHGPAGSRDLCPNCRTEFYGSI